MSGWLLPKPETVSSSISACEMRLGVMHKVFWTGLASLAVGTITIDAAYAQVRPDGTLGTDSSRVRQARFPGRDGVTRDNDVIEGGAQHGSNLFHSFEQFDVPEGRGAYFGNPADVRNIFSRVTGADRSEIFGTLGVLGNANLFFLNPNGILFGPNSSLDVGGSFAATTANGIQFGEQGVFSATDPEALPLLTITPSSFFFNQIASGNSVEIINQSQIGLQVSNNHNLLLLGGNVINDGGQLFSLGGRIDIGAVIGVGEIKFNADRSLSFPENVARGNITFTNQSLGLISVDTDTDKVDFTITGREISIFEGSILGLIIIAKSIFSERESNNLILDAENDIKIRQSTIINIVGSGAMGNAGDLIVTARSLSVEEGAELTVGSLGKGNAGDIIIDASDSVTFDAGSALSNVEATGVGQGGNVKVTADSFSLSNGAQLTASTFGQGNSGNIEIDAGQVNFDGTSRDGRLIINLAIKENAI